MAVRKGDFVEMLWSRYAVRPPSAVLPFSSSDPKQRLLHYQLQSRLSAAPSLYTDTMTEYYTQHRSVQAEEYYELAFEKQWEALERTPNKVNITNFTGVEYVGKSLGTSVFINRNSQLPILTLEKVEEWWNYQDFRQFLFDEAEFSRRFYNWYRRCLEEGVSYVHYDPIWSISPVDPCYELYLYYFSITIKRLKGWRSPIPLYLIYRRTRPGLYVLFAVLVLALNASERFRGKSKAAVYQLSEDFWMTDIHNLKTLMKPQQGIPTSFLYSTFEVFLGFGYMVMSPVFQIMYGPNAREIVMRPFKEAREMAAGERPHPVVKETEDLEDRK